MRETKIFLVTYMIGPFTSDACCISIPIVVAVVLDICGVSGVGGATAYNIHQ